MTLGKPRWYGYCHTCGYVRLSRSRAQIREWKQLHRNGDPRRRHLVLLYVIAKWTVIR